jgi:spore coat polysaccharide biosynthesis predicted glycosyltransferase SpsG
MAYQMTNTDIALVSGGSSMWELMSIGVPFLAIALNSIQESYLKMMCEKGLCSYLGHYLHLDPLILKKSILQFRDNVSLQSEYRQSYAKLINNENQGVKLLNVLFSQ